MAHTVLTVTQAVQKPPIRTLDSFCPVSVSEVGLEETLPALEVWLGDAVGDHVSEGGEDDHRVHAGIFGIPDMTVRAPSELIMQMSMIELLPIGLPDPRGEVAQQLRDAEKRGDVRYYGLLPNLPLALRLTRIMSVNP